MTHKVLVVDDEPALARALAINLRAHGWEVVTAADGRSALDAAFASPGSHDWDLAAADLLVHEAGGVMTDCAGRKLRYNAPSIVHGALIAAGPARHATLLDLVRDRKAEFA